MRLNRRLLLESIIVAAFLIILFMVWKIVQGYMTTKKVVESINDITIEVTDQLPSEVTLSTSQNIEWPIFVFC